MIGVGVKTCEDGIPSRSVTNNYITKQIVSFHLKGRCPVKAFVEVLRNQQRIVGLCEHGRIIINV